MSQVPSKSEIGILDGKTCEKTEKKNLISVLIMAPLAENMLFKLILP